MDTLLQDAPCGGSTDPSTLEALGRRASREYLDHHTPLNQAIVKLAGDHPSLSNEHIKRVVEFANTVTFQELFEKSANKNIHFPVADPGVVLRDLRDGGTPGHARPLHTSRELHATGDYSRGPTRETNDGGALEQAFSTGRASSTDQDSHQEKLAYTISPDTAGHANPVEDIYDAYCQLRRARDEIRADVAQIEAEKTAAEEDLYQAIKHETLDPDGAGLGGITGALERLGRQESQAILPKLASRLRQEGVSELDFLRSMTKTAGKVTNMAHPAVRAFAGLVKSAEALVIAKASLQEVNSSIREVERFLKMAAVKKTSKTANRGAL